MLRAPCNLALYTSRDRESTASPGILFQHLTTLLVKNLRPSRSLAAGRGWLGRTPHLKPKPSRRVTFLFCGITTQGTFPINFQGRQIGRILNSFPVDDVSLMRLRIADEVVHQHRSPVPSFLLRVHCGPSVMLPAQLSWFAAFLQLCPILPFLTLSYFSCSRICLLSTCNYKLSFILRRFNVGHGTDSHLHLSPLSCTALLRWKSMTEKGNRTSGRLCDVSVLHV